MQWLLVFLFPCLVSADVVFEIPVFGQKQKVRLVLSAYAEVEREPVLVSLKGNDNVEVLRDKLRTSKKKTAAIIELVQEQRQLLLSNQVLVQATSGTNMDAVAKKVGAQSWSEMKFLPGNFVFLFETPVAVLENYQALARSHGIREVEPQFLHETQKLITP